MKTNVIMTRDMGNISVQQRTKDGMFNATQLLKSWNKTVGSKGRSGKRLEHFFDLSATKEFIQTIIIEENTNTRDDGYLKTHESTRGKNGGTWMHPFLFIDFAMWINPKFKLQVIKFVHDQLIENRHIAGDNYRMLQSSASTLKGCDYVQVAKALNWVVFGKHSKGLRQQANQEQLKELNKIQGQLAYAIDAGFIKSFDALIKELRQMWHKKNTPKPLTKAA